MKYFLGIDVGSSKTHALIVDEAGQCVGFGKAGGGNHQGVGYDGTQRVMQESFAGALAMSGVDKANIAGAGFGVAGFDFPFDREGHLTAISALGLVCTVEVVNDGVNGLLAGATRGIGVNVTSGSSNNCRGRSKDGKEGASSATARPLANMAAGSRSLRARCKSSIMRGSNARRPQR